VFQKTVGVCRTMS